MQFQSLQRAVDSQSDYSSAERIQQVTDYIWILPIHIGIRASVACKHQTVAIEIEVVLRPTVSRLVRLGVRHPSGTRDQFVFLIYILFRQVRVCFFVAPSLRRGRVCNLLLLLVIVSAVPRDSRPYYCPNS
jgi:hypothetical protein